MSGSLPSTRSTSGKVNGAMLLPAKTEVARHLRRYRAWERVMLASPTDHSVRASFEESGYTLCRLMGKRCAREAAEAAERYLRSDLGAYVRHERFARARARGTVHTGRRGPPASRRSRAGRPG